ncbi:hypothetical protein BV20DRAFT_970967 [Pilatotrama ljubarskyi]|nr:hypothetical protein BV20DRAFT_970967 [Pilatotrama ljubarskyi]
MPPARLRHILGIGHQARSVPSTEPYFAAEKASWRSPDDILSILMIIGGDIVQRAVAQLAGSGPWHFAPVAFSFGWLAYSVSALTSAVGDGRLLPQPDFPAYVVNAKTGYVRENASWVLGRLLRDHEKRTFKGGSLTVAFYRTTPGGRSGQPARDWVYWGGVAVIIAQLGIAVIPGVFSGNWIVLMITVGGTFLALLASGLPQWREEKYAARLVDPKKGREVVCITRGNGSTFAMVVISDRTGIRLEDLAGGRDKRRTSTSVISALLCILWVVLLLTVEGLDGDAWYLLAIGTLGMVQNVVAAGAPRSAEALGLHFETISKDDAIHGKGAKVMEILKRAEEKEMGVGLCMLPLFFPGDLRPDEKIYWDRKRAEKAAREAAAAKEAEAAKKANIAAHDTHGISEKQAIACEAAAVQPDLKANPAVPCVAEGGPVPIPSTSGTSTRSGRRADTADTLVNWPRRCG